MAATVDRQLLSRLFHRFAFGPKPGQFSAALNSNYSTTSLELLSPKDLDGGTKNQNPLTFPDLGPFPKQGTPELIAFQGKRIQQILDLRMWWLDRMVLTDNPLQERANWFWHGHYATSIGKVEYALSMQLMLETFRIYGLGSFDELNRRMMTDAALLYWLDAQQNTNKGPNENFARELMELFTLGVGKYSENDIKEIARGLTGWQVQRSSGTTSFNSKLHDSTPISFLNNNGIYSAEEISRLLTSRFDSQMFIANRMWFRHCSTKTAAPNEVVDSFSTRDIKSLYTSLISPAVLSKATSQVKAPVEWFIGACRALNILPSSLPSQTQVIKYLDAMGQVPLDPPNVGGWPYDEAWLNISNAQARIAFAQYLIRNSKIKIESNYANEMDALADHFGINEISVRTKSVLRSASSLQDLLVLLLCSPEYVVNG